MAQFLLEESLLLATDIEEAALMEAGREKAAQDAAVAKSHERRRKAMEARG